MLQEYMIANARTDEEKLFYLGGALESIRGTVSVGYLGLIFVFLAVNNELQQISVRIAGEYRNDKGYLN